MPRQLPRRVFPGGHIRIAVKLEKEKSCLSLNCLRSKDRQPNDTIKINELSRKSLSQMQIAFTLGVSCDTVKRYQRMSEKEFEA